MRVKVSKLHNVQQTNSNIMENSILISLKLHFLGLACVILDIIKTLFQLGNDLSMPRTSLVVRKDNINYEDMMFLDAREMPNLLQKHLDSIPHCIIKIEQLLASLFRSTII